MSDEKRIYVVLPKTVHVTPPDYRTVYGLGNIDMGYEKDIEQVSGRQIAQACHVVSKLRYESAIIDNRGWGFEPITTIILECRSTKEMMHLFTVLTGEGKQPTLFQDENGTVYGDVKPITAMAVYALPSEVESALGYLPLWGAQ